MDKKVGFLVSFVVLFVALGSGGTFPTKFAAAEFATQNHAEVLYGQGVHSFFNGDYEAAIEVLSKLDTIKAEDPRAYFFLALAQKRLGENDLADKNFKKAARLELEKRTARDFNISATLRRIQGRERLEVEQYRRAARLEWQKIEKKRRQVLFGEQKAKDREILTELAQGESTQGELTQSEPKRGKMKHPVIATAPFGAQSVNPFGKIDSEAAVPAAATPETITPAAVTPEPLENVTETEDVEDPFQ